MRYIVKVVLPVVTQAKGEGKVGPDANTVFERSVEDLFKEYHVAAAFLENESGRLRLLVVREAGKGVRSAGVGEIVEAPAADVGRFEAEGHGVLSGSVGGDVCAVKVVLGAIEVGL